MIRAHRDHLASVARRASFIAAVVAVDPSLVNFTISAVVTSEQKRSAHSSSVKDGRLKLVPTSSDLRTASTTIGCA